MNKTFDPTQFGALAVEETNNNASTFDASQFGAVPFDPSSFGATPVEPENTGPFKYDVPEPTLTPEQKKARYDNAVINAEKSAKESKRANSFLGILGNTVKGVGETLAASEIGLGKTMAKVFDRKTVKMASDNVAKLTDTQIKTQKLIKQYEAQGKDATALKRAFNSNQDLIQENIKAINDFNNNLPTTGQVLGQIGGTALDVLTAGTYKGVGVEAKTAVTSKSLKPALANPAMGKLAPKATSVAKKASTIISPELTKVGEIANEKATGILTKKGMGKIAQGAGVGYASDVTEGLQGRRGEDRTGGKAFIPGIGTAVGAGSPAVSETIQSTKNQFGKGARFNRTIERRKNDLSKFDQNKTIEKVVSKAKDKGFDVKEFVANSDLLYKSVDKTGTVSTKGDGQAVAKMQEFLAPHEDVVTKLIKKEGGSIAPKDLLNKMYQSIDDAGLQGSSLIKARKEAERDIAGYMLKANSDGKIPLDIVHKAKIDKYSNINFFTDAEKSKSGKAIARALKDTVQENTHSANIKKLNDELGQYYTVIDYLEKLDGKKVEGGRLGKHFARTVGAIVGSHFGPLGAIGGVEAADLLKSKSFKGTFGGKLGQTIKSSEALQKATQEANKPNLMLPAPKEGAYRSVNTGGKPINMGSKAQSTVDAIEMANPNIKRPISQKGLGNLMPKNNKVIDTQTGANNLAKDVDSLVNKNGSGVKAVTQSEKSYRIEFNNGKDPVILNKDFIKKNNINTSFIDNLKKEQPSQTTNKLIRKNGRAEYNGMSISLDQVKGMSDKQVIDMLLDTPF